MAHFQYLLDNFKNRLAGLKSNMLSMAGRLTLINSTLNTLPNHIKQFIQLPTRVKTLSEHYQHNFLWGTTTQRRKLHLIKWDILQTPKACGGLGIQNLTAKNNAHLAGLAWRLFNFPRTLWGSLLISKYKRTKLGTSYT